MAVWNQIFRAGQYPQGDVSESDLDDVVRNFDPARLEVPIVLGHPKSDDPAYGWVAGLKRAGSLLLATFKEVAPAFREAFDAGRYKQVSVRLRRGERGCELAHVGFLGAALPAVEGLARVQFSDDEGGLDYVSAAGREDGVDEDKVREIVEQKLAEQRQALEADFSRREQALKQDLATERKARRRAEVATDVARRVELGSLTPALADGLADFLLALDGVAVVDFAAGGKTPTAWFGEWLDRLPKQVTYGAVAGADSDPGRRSAQGDCEFAEGLAVDSDGAALDRKVKDYQRAHQGVGYNDALTAVLKGVA